MDLAETNVNVIKAIAPQITKYCPDATYIIVSNPVDILTYVFHKVTNIPHERIIGSGTLLDTARLRARLAEYLNVSAKTCTPMCSASMAELRSFPGPSPRSAPSACLSIRI